MNMLAFMTFYHPILLHTRFTAEPKKSKLGNKFWKTYTTLCHIYLLQRIQSLILSQHQREGRILLSLWLQQEADCYLITVLLFFTLLRCKNLQTEPSHEPHRYDVALHYLFIHSILHAPFFFTFTGVINMIHSFNMESCWFMIACNAQSKVYVNIGIIGCACLCISHCQRNIIYK